MAQIDFTVSRIRMNARLIERIHETVKQLSLAEASTYLRSDAADDSTTSFAEEVIADGGRAFFGNWEVKDAKKVARNFRLPSGEPDLSALDSCSQYEVAVYSASPKTQARVFIRTYVPSADLTDAMVTVTADEGSIDGLLASVNEILGDYVVPVPPTEPPPFKVFIGHGGDPQWKYLQRALTDTHNIRAEAFESSERVGYHTLVVVDQMVRSSSVAIVVMTGEDTMPDGSLRARENVVHEIGFCQGALGIDRTIVVMEQGISEPSNIQGLTQIRFPKGALIDVEARIVEAIQQRQQAHDYAYAQ